MAAFSPKQPAAPIDRAAVMRDAHKRFRAARRLGLDWAFGRCLSTAWRAAKLRSGFRDIPPARRHVDRPFPQRIAA